MLPLGCRRVQADLGVHRSRVADKFSEASRTASRAAAEAEGARAAGQLAARAKGPIRILLLTMPSHASNEAKALASVSNSTNAAWKTTCAELYRLSPSDNASCLASRTPAAERGRSADRNHRCPELSYSVKDARNKWHWHSCKPSSYFLRARKAIGLRFWLARIRRGGHLLATLQMKLKELDDEVKAT